MSDSALRPRLRLLRVLHAQPHRYTRLRWATQGLTLLASYAVPLLGLARLDLWGGHHRVLGHSTGRVYGLGAVIVSVGALYLVTFVLNAVLGRVFCGFGCPVGQASRLGDAVEIAAATRKGRLAAEVRAASFALAIAAAIALWFVSPRVFVEGSARAIATAIGGTAALAAAVYAHGRWWRWRFCESWCPIGVYYSAVQTAHDFGVHFDEGASTCKDCDSCALVCPVGLDPRDLSKPKNGLAGIGIEGFPERNHCLTCGDCVRACEHRFRKEGAALVPLRLSFRPTDRGGAVEARRAS